MGAENIENPHLMERRAICEVNIDHRLSVEEVASGLGDVELSKMRGKLSRSPPSRREGPMNK